MITKTRGEISELKKKGLDFEGLRSAVEQIGETLKLITGVLASMPKGIWSVKEAAEKLGLSEQHLRLLLKKGEVKGKKLGGTWVVLELSYIRKRREPGMIIPQTWDQPIAFQTETGETKEGKK